MSNHPSATANRPSRGTGPLADDRGPTDRQALARLALDSLAQFVFLVNAKGEVLDVNQTALDTVGLSISEVERRPLWKTRWWEVSEALQSELRLAVARAAHGEPVDWAAEIHGAAQENLLVSVEIRVRPLRSTSGPIDVVCVEARETSEESRRRHTLDQSWWQREEYLRAVVNTTPACIKLVSADGTVLDMNAAGLAMVDADCVEQVKGKSVYTLICPEYREAFRAFHERICRGEKGTLQFQIVGLRGTNRRMETHAVPLRGARGEVCQLAITHDITERKQAEDALKASEERFRSLSACSPVGIFTTDTQGRCTYTNPRCEVICGFTAPEALGEGWATFVHAEDRQQVFHEWSQAAMAGREYAGKFRWQHRDGTVRWSHVRSSPMLSVEGPWLGHVGTVEDITEQKQSEAMLVGQKRVLEKLVEGAPLPEVLESLCDIIEGQSDEPLIASILLLDESGRRLRSAAGRRLPEHYSRAIDGVEIGPSVGSCGTAAYRGAPVIVSDIATDPLWANYRDLALGAGLHACWSTPILSSQGKVLGTFAVYYPRPHEPAPQDLRLVELLIRTASIAIERRRVEQALDQQNQRLRLLWGAAAILLTTDEPDAMLRGLFERIRESLGLDLYLNFMVAETGDALRLLSHAGIPEEQARSLPRLESEQAASETLALHRQSIVAENIQASTDPVLQLVKSLGATAYASAPLMASGRFLGTLAFASRSRDHFEPEEIEFLETITQYVTAAYERLRLIEQLRDQDRRKNEFLATLAHELRNPLAPIRYGLQLLSLGENDPSTLHEARVMMERQVQQMVRLVDDLLDVSRISRNRLEMRKQRVDLAEVIQSAIETSRPLIDAARHQLTVALPPECITLEADPVRLAQAFANLLNNAAKYSEAGGQIWLSVERPGHEVVVRVRDTGIGIPTEQLPHIFEMFVQVDRSLERSRGGLGIGLTLIQRIIQMHGGSVSAWSAGTGQGSEFVVRLPVAPTSPATPDDARENNHATGTAAKRHRILVADDNRDAATSLAMMLRLMGHETQVAHDGWEALQQAADFHPDLMFLDIGMPKLNGYDTARRIRSESWGQSLALVALTGWGQETDRRRSQEAGFNFHLTKPADADELRNLLRDLS